MIRDSLINIEALTSRANDLQWEIYVPAQKIREKVKEFAAVKFKAMRRNYKHVAHSPAKIGLFYNYDGLSMLNDVPCSSIS